MRTVAVVLCLLLGVPAAVAGPAEPHHAPARLEPPVLPFKVVDRFSHDPKAFTQGLDFRGRGLFETTGLYGESTLRKVRLATGEVLRKRSISDDYFGEGLTIFNGNAYWLTWKENTAFVHDPRTFERTGGFTYEGEGWGLTHDGESLIMSDGRPALVYRDPDTFAITRTLPVTDGDSAVDNLNELEWVEGRVYANVWPSNDVAIIDPASGIVEAWLDLSSLQEREESRRDVDVPNGIAYRAKSNRLFVTGKLWAHIYEIEITG